MEFDVIKSNDLQVLASTVKTYLQGGWILRGEIVEHSGDYVQELVRQPAKSKAGRERVQRQKSWIAWPKF